MSKHLNKFTDQSAYDAGICNASFPAVSLVGSSIVYDKSIPNGVYIKYTDGTYSPYNSLTTGKTPLGVALKTNNVAILIHPSEGSGTWQTEDTLIDGVTTITEAETAKTDYAGAANTAAVIASGKAGSAFTFATSIGDGWYLPGAGEMAEIFTNVTNINEALGLISGTTIPQYSDDYWTSTQYVFAAAWRVCNSDSYSVLNMDTKSFSHKCRAVRNL